MIKYQPNFRDRRVLNRIRHAYGFARAVINERPHAWSTRYIDKYFGQQQTQLSNWLRSQLLICTNHRYSKDTGQTKEYRLNVQGADYIRSILLNESQEPAVISREIDWQPIENSRYDQYVVDKFIASEWHCELANKTFVYQDISERLWHPLQNIRREQRQRIFANYNLSYQYDIQTAAVTLIHQHAQRQLEPMDLYLFALRNYLTDRQQQRQRLAQELEIDIKTAKVIINALFCGARIGLGNEFAISQLLDNDPARISWLKQDPYIQELRSDIRTCWEYIKPSMTRRSITDRRGQQRFLAMTSKQKWQRYFELERCCLSAIRQYLDQTNNLYFLEHDGWTSQQQVNLEELEVFVRNTTGFELNFELTKTFTGVKRRQLMSDLID